MAGEMGFGQQAEPSDSARAWELVPDGFTDGPQGKVFDNEVKQRVEFAKVAEGCRITPVGFDDPLQSSHFLLLRGTTLGTEFTLFGHRLAAVDTELRFTGCRCGRGRRAAGSAGGCGCFGGPAWTGG